MISKVGAEMSICLVYSHLKVWFGDFGEQRTDWVKNIGLVIIIHLKLPFSVIFIRQFL